MHYLPKVPNHHQSNALLETLSTEDGLGPKCLLLEDLLSCAKYLWSAGKLRSQAMCTAHTIITSSPSLSYLIRTCASKGDYCRCSTVEVKPKARYFHLRDVNEVLKVLSRLYQHNVISKGEPR